MAVIINSFSEKPIKEYQSEAYVYGSGFQSSGAIVYFAQENNLTSYKVSQFILYQDDSVIKFAVNLGELNSGPIYVFVVNSLTEYNSPGHVVTLVRDPAIYTINHGTSVVNNKLNIEINGREFSTEDVLVEFSDCSDYEASIKVSQLVKYSSKELILIDVDKGQLDYGTNYIFITIKLGYRNSFGFEFNITKPESESPKYYAVVTPNIEDPGTTYTVESDLDKESDWMIYNYEFLAESSELYSVARDESTSLIECDNLSPTFNMIKFIKPPEIDKIEIYNSENDEVIHTINLFIYDTYGSIKKTENWKYYVVYRFLTRSVNQEELSEVILHKKLATSHFPKMKSIVNEVTFNSICKKEFTEVLATSEKSELVNSNLITLNYQIFHLGNLIRDGLEVTKQDL